MQSHTTKAVIEGKLLEFASEAKVEKEKANE